VELYVYSSTIVYGTDYDLKHGSEYASLFERAKNMKNVFYMGYAPNTEVTAALRQSHIFAYPSMFEETCCLAMIEAGAAGCKIIGQNLGALAETGAEFATLVPIQIDKKSIAEKYASALNKAIDNYWNDEPMLKQQSRYFNHFYSWDRIVEQWERVLKNI
jgi:UDP-glucose:(glucosyl)LPS alpha-1,2-glucosyltransferase